MHMQQMCGCTILIRTRAVIASTQSSENWPFPLWRQKRLLILGDKGNDGRCSAVDCLHRISFMHRSISALLLFLCVIILILFLWIYRDLQFGPYSPAPEKSEVLKIWPFWKKSEKKVRNNQSEKIGQKKIVRTNGQKKLVRKNRYLPHW